MDPKTVRLKGPGGKYARLGTIGAGLFDWYDVHWDGTDPNDSKYHWTMTKPDSLFGFRPPEDVGWLGIDATKFSSDLGMQFYVKPGGADARGAYESPVVYENTVVGELLGLVEYSDGKYPSAAFAVEIV